MSLLNALASSKVKLFAATPPEAQVASLTLTLHKYMAFVVLGGCIVAQSGQYFGASIHCAGETKGISQSFVETACWFQGTYSFEDAFDDQDGHVAMPGIRGHVADEAHTAVEGQKRYSYKYYQWVGLMLLFQFACLYLPYRVWRRLEGGRVASIVKLANDDAGTEKQLAGKFLITHFGTYTTTAVKFVACELVAAVNVFVQLWLLNLFFHGRFYNLGHRWLHHDENSSTAVHPGLKLFPRFTKCEISSFGSNGNVEKTDLLCALPLNEFFEKLFIAIWFLLVALAIWSCFKMVYHVLLAVSSGLRSTTLSTKSPRTPKGLVRTVIRLCDYGDWFVLDLLARNLDQASFKNTLEYVGRNMRVIAVDDLDDYEDHSSLDRVIVRGQGHGRTNNFNEHNTNNNINCNENQNLRSRTGDQNSETSLRRKQSHPPQYDMTNFDMGKVDLV